MLNWPGAKGKAPPEASGGSRTSVKVSAVSRRVFRTVNAAGRMGSSPRARRSVMMAAVAIDVQELELRGFEALHDHLGESLEDAPAQLGVFLAFPPQAGAVESQGADE